MFASHYEVKFQPGKLGEAVQYFQSVKSELAKVDGLKQALVIKRAEDTALIIAIYGSQAQQEAAAPRAKELMGEIAATFASPPKREGCEVLAQLDF